MIAPTVLQTLVDVPLHMRSLTCCESAVVLKNDLVKLMDLVNAMYHHIEMLNDEPSSKVLVRFRTTTTRSNENECDDAAEQCRRSGLGVK